MFRRELFWVCMHAGNRVAVLQLRTERRPSSIRDGISTECFGRWQDEMMRAVDWTRSLSWWPWSEGALVVCSIMVVGCALW